jgi:hypothetical protein
VTGLEQKVHQVEQLQKRLTADLQEWQTKAAKYKKELEESGLLTKTIFAFFISWMC